MTDADRIRIPASIVGDLKTLLDERGELRIHDARKISVGLFRRVRELPKEGIYELCGNLLSLVEIYPKRGWVYGTIAFDWAFRMKKEYKRRDFEMFQSWLNLYVRSWEACDDFCTHALGYMLYSFPELVRETKKWALSSDRWHRRAAAVSIIYSLRRRKLLAEAFQVADILLRDTDEMVQRGYGWILKEASKKFPGDVFNYVMIHRDVMPRTALRYAIEHLSPAERAEAMKREKRP